MAEGSNILTPANFALGTGDLYGHNTTIRRDLSDVETRAVQRDNTALAMANTRYLRDNQADGVTYLSGKMTDYMFRVDNQYFDLSRQARDNKDEILKQGYETKLAILEDGGKTRDLVNQRYIDDLKDDRNYWRFAANSNANRPIVSISGRDNELTSNRAGGGATLG